MLELAATEGRVLVTRSSKDYAPARSRVGRRTARHVGGLLIWMLDHSQFEQIVACIERYLEPWPTQAQWRDLVAAS